MVRRVNMTRPRMRLEQGSDPSAAVERLYRASQLDRGDGLVHVNRRGEIIGSPTGFTGAGPAYQKPQFSADQHGPGIRTPRRAVGFMAMAMPRRGPALIIQDRGASDEQN